MFHQKHPVPLTYPKLPTLFLLHAEPIQINWLLSMLADKVIDSLPTNCVLLLI
ncbi:MAG TPA: hypothetical protein PLQ57_12680 [Saprospiraceae bacterium]|nr:hypothetical protein [Saprospiraceae bacterium]HRG21887.1 hypothetical protein [Saprospiraceae bacterium]